MQANADKRKQMRVPLFIGVSYTPFAIPYIYLNDLGKGPPTNMIFGPELITEGLENVAMVP